MKKTVAAFLTLLLLLGFGSTALAFSGADITAQFHDSEFRKAVINALIAEGVYDGSTIGSDDVLAITELDLTGLTIAGSGLNGLELLLNLKKLVCSGLGLTRLPDLPSSLKYLDCSDNALTAFTDTGGTGPLPAGLEYLDISKNQFADLPSLPVGLTVFKCSENLLPYLPFLPDGLTVLNCSDNLLPGLPPLPGALIEFNCSNNQLPGLPAPLPPSLSILNCSNNPLKGPGGIGAGALPTLPGTLTELYCSHCNLYDGLPTFPGGLTVLDCSNNGLQGLPEFPGGLTWLDLSDNNLALTPWIVELPLTYFNCSGNPLPRIPMLPVTLIILDNGTVRYEAITDITALPTTATVGTPLALTGTKNPADATAKIFPITWAVDNAGTTGATIVGGKLNTTAAGTVTIRATIENGTAFGTSYTKVFTIKVSVPPTTPSTSSSSSNWDPSRLLALNGYNPDGTKRSSTAGDAVPYAAPTIDGIGIGATTTKKIPVYERESTKSKKLFTITDINSEVKILGVSQGFAYVEVDGVKGYIQLSRLNISFTVRPTYITKAKAKAYSESGMKKAQLLTTIAKNEEVGMITSLKGSKACVEYDGQELWVSFSNLKLAPLA